MYICGKVIVVVFCALFFSSLMPHYDTFLSFHLIQNIPTINKENAGLKNVNVTFIHRLIGQEGQWRSSSVTFCLLHDIKTFLSSFLFELKHAFMKRLSLD